jgi:hypothetical protein
MGEHRVQPITTNMDIRGVLQDLKDQASTFVGKIPKLFLSKKQFTFAEILDGLGFKIEKFSKSGEERDDFQKFVNQINKAVPFTVFDEYTNLTQNSEKLYLPSDIIKDLGFENEEAVAIGEELDKRFGKPQKIVFSKKLKSNEIYSIQDLLEVIDFDITGADLNQFELLKEKSRYLEDTLFLLMNGVNSNNSVLNDVSKVIANLQHKH